MVLEIRWHFRHKFALMKDILFRLYRLSLSLFNGASLHYALGDDHFFNDDQKTTVLLCCTFALIAPSTATQINFVFEYRILDKNKTLTDVGHGSFPFALKFSIVIHLNLKKNQDIPQSILINLTLNYEQSKKSNFLRRQQNSIVIAPKHLQKTLGFETSIEPLNSSVAVSLNFENPPASNCFLGEAEKAHCLVLNQRIVLFSSSFDPFVFKRSIHCFTIR